MDLEGWGELFLSLCRGREVAWEELFSSPEGRRTMAWEELTSSEGRCTAPGRGLLHSPGGRWAIARSRKTAWCLVIGRAVTFWGRVNSCQGRIASFPRRKVSNCHSGKDAWCLTIGRTVTFQGRVNSCWGRIATFPGRKVSPGRGGMTAYYLIVSLG